MHHLPGRSVVVQAGGMSKRMGHDKALAPFLGKPLVQRVIDRLAPLADELVVVTNRPDEYRFLGLPLFEDIYPGRGALGGLYTALKVSSRNMVAVAACDMPFVNRELLDVQFGLLEKEKADAVIPRTVQGMEPFHSVYRMDTCLPVVDSALAEGLWRVDSWLKDVRVRYLSPLEIQVHDPDGLAFWNVNTPDDLARAEVIALRHNEMK
jgi:molybdenum cofactor guanylyltransferase